VHNQIEQPVLEVIPVLFGKRLLWKTLRINRSEHWL